MITYKTSLLAVAVSTLSTNALAFADRYKLEQVTDSVYRFVNDRHRSIVVNGDDGLLVTDPMHPHVAT